MVPGFRVAAFEVKSPLALMLSVTRSVCSVPEENENGY